MPRRYSSFLLRCWVMDDEVRVEIQHMQSGRRAREISLPAALKWLEGFAGAEPEDDESVGALPRSGEVYSSR